MSSYISGRYHTVTIDGKLSEPVKMTFSMPHGSVLGPKFYTIYTRVFHFLDFSLITYIIKLTVL